MPKIVINGPEGRIEGQFHESKLKSPPAALVLHPHPEHGGTMNNKVVYNVYHCLAMNGFSVLRINFRGVGYSEGKFDDGIGELNDAAAALDWLQVRCPSASTFWLGGFSFGSWIAMQLLMRRPEVEGFVAVSPPAGKYDFNFLSPCPAYGIVMQGDNDSVVDVEDVNRLVDKLAKQKNSDVSYNIIRNADHFFRMHMDELKDNLNSYIGRKLVSEANKPKKVKSDRRRKKNLIPFD